MGPLDHAAAAPFPWAVVGELALVAYVYASAVRRGAARDALLGLGFWSVEFVWEIANALVLHFTHRAPLWGVAGQSAGVIYVGLNVEIALMFAVAPMVLFALLPADPARRVLGVPNRVLVPAGLGLFCVAVEVLLNRAGALVWTFAFWRWPHVELICVAYCAPFLAVAWVRDHASARGVARGSVVAMAAAGCAHLVFATALRWA